MDKKILIVTMDCFNKYNSATTANTFETLFKNYDSKNLASLYLREEIPSGNACSLYFQISENAVVKSSLKRAIKTGKLFTAGNIEISSEDKHNINKTKDRYKKYGVKRRWLLLFAREFLWKIGRWKSKELDYFLDEFKPDIIIFGAEGYLFFHRIVRYSIKKTGAKAISFFWDDNFSFKQRPKTPIFLLLRTLQRKTLKKTMALTKASFSISEKTKKEVDEFFDVESTVITKPVEECLFNLPALCNEKIKMVYTGNLKIGRFESLKLISKVLDENENIARRMSIDIYSSTYIPKKELNNLNSSIHFKGAISSDEVINVQRSADVLLLLEDILGKWKYIPRLSFSTKITDYLGHGKPIFSIALKDIASSEYLINNDCAIVAGNLNEIENSLNEIIQGKEKLLLCAKNSYETAIKNHSRKIIEEKFYGVLNNL